MRYNWNVIKNEPVLEQFFILAAAVITGTLDLILYFILKMGLTLYLWLVNEFELGFYFSKFVLNSNKGCLVVLIFRGPQGMQAKTFPQF